MGLGQKLILESIAFWMDSDEVYIAKGGYKWDALF